MSNIGSFKIVRFAAMLIAICCLSGILNAQTAPDEITPEETREAKAVAKEFSDAMMADKDVKQLLAKLFVSDFIERVSKDWENDQEAKSDPFKKMKREEVERCFIAEINFMYLSQFWFAGSFDLGPNPDPDPGKIKFEDEYPLGVAALLKTVYRKDEDGDYLPRAKETVESVKKFTEVHEKAAAIMRDYLAKHPVENTPIFKKNYAYLDKRSSFMRPSVHPLHEEELGFPVGTRWIIIDVPFYQLGIVRVNGQMKITNLATW